MAPTDRDEGVLRLARRYVAGGRVGAALLAVLRAEGLEGEAGEVD